MRSFAALTLKLAPDSSGQYFLEMDLRLDFPGRNISTQQLPRTEVAVKISTESLLACAHDPTAYGSQLSSALFGNSVALTALKVARTHADAAKVPLHVGLDLSACAPEIQSLRWETLQDPEPNHTGWAFSERVILSRRLASSDMIPVEPRNRPVQSALIAIAAPSDLPKYGFSPISVAAELERAQVALHPLRRDVLAQQHGSPCTIRHLLTYLRNKPDILCLIAHGRNVGGEVYLWLENDLGQSEPISSHALASHLAALDPAARPPLIIFASCESGGVDSGRIPLSAIGPLLASQGIAAVLAMQGQLSVETNAIFLPAVLREVLRDGVIDRAVAAARISVAQHTNWWAPVLWLRLPHGQLWTSRTPMSQNSLKTTKGNGAMQYSRGFAVLKDYLTHTNPDEVAVVAALETRFEENQHSERIFGPTELTRSERTRIIYSLEQIALTNCGISFVDLCRGVTPS
jgi:hypothetical protein